VDEIVARHATPDRPLMRRTLLLHQDIAHAFAAIVEHDWRTAERALMRAQEGAESMKFGAVRVDVMTLRAFVLIRDGADGTAMLNEAVNLGEVYGMKLVPPDLDPALTQWLRARDANGGPLAPVLAPQPSTVAPALTEVRESGPRATLSMALTPKERCILELLTRHMTNKEIALAMGIGQETVKWHLKNLFVKLDAGSRKHIVRRAQLMGLLHQAA
jgi:LuxR family maltose regulon positive regulatory protein